MANTAPYVRAKEIAAAPPTSAGGMPSPGWYYLTEWDWYTGPDGGVNDPNEDLAETLALSVAGNVVTLQQIQNSGPVTAEVSQTMTMTLNGTNKGTLQYSCPTPSQPAQLPYSASATTFTLYGLGRGYVYTKQSDGPIDLVAACKAMQAAFDAALLAARKCDPASTSACQSTASLVLIGCADDCQVAVNDPGVLEGMWEHFGQAGCMKLPGHSCPPCAGPDGLCQAQAGGGGMCVPK
jgi:hypothetical protein